MEDPFRSLIVQDGFDQNVAVLESLPIHCRILSKSEITLDPEPDLACSFSLKASQ